MCVCVCVCMYASKYAASFGGGRPNRERTPYNSYFTPGPRRCLKLDTEILIDGSISVVFGELSVLYCIALHALAS